MANPRSVQIKMDDAAALRAELEIELKNKKQCAYQTYECTQLSLDGYKFCSKHILQDKNAPFKQCSYIYSSNGKRCHIPAQRVDKRDYGYCSEHALKATLARNKQNAKNPPPRTAEVLLHSLSHYIRNPHPRSDSSSTQYPEENDCLTEDDQKVTKFSDPFIDIDAPTIINEKCSEVLDFCSESDSDIEASTYSSVWHDGQADSSDNESIDSEQEDPLKHANVYTGEEVTLITRDKLIRLQSLYIEQYRHLQYLLTEKRRKYLHSLKRERETCCNISTQLCDNPKEQRLYKKLKALNNYQKCHGNDGILNKKLKDLRLKITDSSLSKSSSYSKCSFTEGGVKCGERSIPLSKYCQKHILEDPNQVLYRSCGKITGDITCTTPIAAIFDESTCHLHLEIPVLRSYNHLRKDSESDVDDTVDAHLHYTTQLTEDIKNEFINYVPPEIPKMETLPTMLFEENSTSNNEVINDNFIFGNDSDQNNLDNKLDFKMELQEETVQEMNFEDIPECLSAEVEISTEVDENEAKGEDMENSETNVGEIDYFLHDDSDDRKRVNEDILYAMKQTEMDICTINSSTENNVNEITNAPLVSAIDVLNEVETVTEKEVGICPANEEETLMANEIEISIAKGVESSINEVETSTVDEVETTTVNVVETSVHEVETSTNVFVNEVETSRNVLETSFLNEVETSTNELGTSTSGLEASSIDQAETPIVNEMKSSITNQVETSAEIGVETTAAIGVDTTTTNEEMPSISKTEIIENDMVVSNTGDETINDEMKNDFVEQESTVENNSSEEISEQCGIIQEHIAENVDLNSSSQ